MRLITMTDYVLEQGKTDRYVLTDDECFKHIFNYAHFLKQPLTLGMFVPCDLEGVVLKEPSCYDDWLNGDYPEMNLMAKCNLYEKATERVLFEGCNIGRLQTEARESIHNKNGMSVFINYTIGIWDFENRIIESIIMKDLTLTPNAVKQIKG